ncbi:MAG: Rpn family recombination-promoting nuclease/putative transposase [Bacteroidota bacterium]
MSLKREYVDPKVDIAFRKIFGDEKRKHILISLLNAVMNKGIVEVEIVNPYQIPKLPELKYTILDVKAKDVDGKEYIVEMQSNPYAWFDKRALDYISRAYAEQLSPGEDYKQHQPVYFIGVLDFNHFKSEHYLSKHYLLNLETYEQEIVDFELYFLELKKFNKKVEDLEDALDKWIFFLKELEEMNALPEELAEVPEISEAAHTAKQSTWTKEEMDAYYKGLREEAKELNLIQELEAKSEELEAKSEELQAKREELEAKSEELEAKNEELEIQKEELQNRNTALKKAAVHLSKSGMTDEQIAKVLSLDPKIVRELL